MDLLIGCPVLRREWIIEPWAERALRAAELVDVDPGFVLVAPRKDETVDVLRKKVGEARVVHVPVFESRIADQRNWSKDRYQRMVDLRNILLEEVREIAPTQFLSLDSDILLHEDAVKRMAEAIEANQWAACGSKCFMQPGHTKYPSYGVFRRHGEILHREDSKGTFKVDVIMAIKLMTPAAYNVNYAMHRWGEDIGWSKECASAGLTLGWDGGVCSKHVMTPEELNIVDKRVGF